jgi:Tfp pilus assembly protein FimT
MKSKIKGITLIEILLVLGLLAILLSFAVPSVSGAVSKAEMKSTLENIQYSLQVARRTARVTETEVSMHISPAGQEATQTITFSSPGKGGASNHLQIQDFTLPAEFALITDHDSFIFDQRGLVEEPGRILLVSKGDESVTSTIDID